MVVEDVKFDGIEATMAGFSFTEYQNANKTADNQKMPFDLKELDIGSLQIDTCAKLEASPDVDLSAITDYRDSQAREKGMIDELKYAAWTPDPTIIEFESVEPLHLTEKVNEIYPNLP